MSISRRRCHDRRRRHQRRRQHRRRRDYGWRYWQQRRGRLTVATLPKWGAFPQGAPFRCAAEANYGRTGDRRRCGDLMPRPLCAHPELGCRLGADGGSGRPLGLPAMRVLVAVDGSSGSEQAARLVGSMAWPPETTIVLLSVVDPGAWIPPSPGVPGRQGLVRDGEVAAYYQGHQLAITDQLAGAGPTAESAVVHGRPADSIVDEAKRIDADLVVLGRAAMVESHRSCSDRSPRPSSIARRVRCSSREAAASQTPCSLWTARALHDWRRESPRRGPHSRPCRSLW
jgi:nucleotide-binding universal stress UspA family protein